MHFHLQMSLKSTKVAQPIKSRDKPGERKMDLQERREYAIACTYSFLYR